MILLFDTSGKDLHCGLYDPASGSMKQEFHYIASASERGVHDTMLASSVDTLLQKEKLTAKDIQRIGFINGPGSFTGLRIGLAFAKVLAYGSGCEIAPILAHQWLAECARKQYSDLAFTAVLTAGYEPSSVYYASTEETSRISLRKKSELTSQEVAVAFEALPAVELPITIVTTDLAILGELTVTAEAKDLTTLDPFYGTDFKPHPGSKKAS